MPEKFSNNENLPQEITPQQELVRRSEQSAELNPEQLVAKKLFDLLTRVHPTEMRPKSEALENMIERYGATSFLTKFERQKQGEGWKIGEKVGGNFIITDAHKADGTIDKTKIVLLVDGIDIRQSDEFVVDVSPEEYEAAQQFKGFTFNGVVEIVSEGKYHVSNMFSYDAKPVTLESHLPINPDSIEEMKTGEVVIVEGKVVDFKITEYWSFTSRGQTEPDPKTAVITLKTASGNLIEVKIDPKIAYEQSSRLENILRKAPEMGDVVRINTTVINKEQKENSLQLERGELAPTDEPPKTEVIKKPTTKVLYAPWCRSTYLLEPSPERQQAYDELREVVGRQTADLEIALANTSYQEARNLVSQIIKREVTDAERNKLNNLTESMPEDERPLMVWRRYYADAINKLFGIDIDAMARQEFYEFSKKIVSTPFEKRLNIKSGSPEYIFDVMDDIKMPPENQEEIMTLAAETRIKYFEDLDQKGEGYDHDRDWEDRFMAGQSLEYLTHLQTPTAAQHLIELSHRILASKSGGSGVLKDELGDEAADALRSLYDHCKEGSDVQKVLEDNLDKIKEMERQLVDEQVASPETKDSRVITFVRGNETDPRMAFRVFATPQVHHKRSSELEALRGVIGRLDPFLRELRKIDFNEGLIARMKELAEKSPFFAQSLEAVKQKGYKFVLYNSGDTSIPPSVHRLMYGSNGAITSKEDRTVYFDLDAISSFAFRQGRNTEVQLNHALIDESVHMMSDLTYQVFSAAETEDELKRLERSPRLTVAEKNLHEVIKEEILADIVSRIVTKQLETPGHKMAEGDLNLDSDFAKSELVNIKVQLGMNVLNRIYSVDLATLSENEQKLIFGRLAEFLGSGQIEKHLKTKLKELDLLG